MMNNKSSRLIPKKAMICVVAVCVLFISLIFTAYAEDIVDEGNPYEAVVKGTVYDAETKSLIQNALVTIEYHEVFRKAFTDSSGQYLFEGVPECFCLKNMTASKTGYMPQEIWVAVSDVTVVDFYLNPFENGTEPTGGIVTGWVNDADTNEPIEEAEMTITYHESIQVEYTDSNGRYTFENVPICFCLKNISATKKGYESQYQLIAVSEVTYLNFSLEPIEIPEEPEEPEEPEDPENPEEPKEPENPEETPDNKDGMYGTLTGMVADTKTNFPISDALMTLKYHDLVRFEKTDSKGFYEFTDVPICFCLKNISASKKGYESQYYLVGVSEITYANFSLVPLSEPDDPEDPEDPEEPEEPDEPQEPKEPEGALEGVIHGKVIDAETNLPIEEVLMTLKYHDDMHMLYTDSDGSFKFTNVPICFCLKNISASKEGYVTEYQLVAVSEDTFVTFSLEPGDSNVTIPSPDAYKGKASDDGEPYLNNYCQVLAVSSTILVSLLVIGLIIYALRRRKDIR